MTITPKDLAGRMQPLPKAEPNAPRREKRKRQPTGNSLIELQQFSWENRKPGLTLHLKNRTNPRDFVFFTPESARNLADRLHDMADKVEAAQNQKEAGR